MKLNVATCQFPVDRTVASNLRYIERYLRQAQSEAAHVVHFSECCLSGYAGIEFASFEHYDWANVENGMRQVQAWAAELRLWVVIGSNHRLTAPHKPHNSLYVIDDRGRLVDRYDKLFCTGSKSKPGGDLKHYSPGDHFVDFTIRGVRCGLLICHDFRYQELYREYRRRGVRLMFHSYHNGHSTREKLQRQNNIWGVIVPPTMQAYAANNAMWVSANNTSRRESSWPSFFVQPDGVISGRLTNNRAGLLLSTVDTKANFYDASAEWRDRALRGVYHSGACVRDARSRNRHAL